MPAIDRSWQGEPNVTISTGSMFAPWIWVTSSRCFISGNRVLVTSIGKGSISEQLTGVMPTRLAANGNPPEPSNSEQRVNGLCVCPTESTSASPLLFQTAANTASAYTYCTCSCCETGKLGNKRPVHIKLMYGLHLFLLHGDIVMLTGYSVIVHFPTSLLPVRISNGSLYSCSINILFTYCQTFCSRIVAHSRFLARLSVLTSLRWLTVGFPSGFGTKT